MEEIFSKFPGIGPRQAKRFVYHLLNKSPSYTKEFARLIEEVRSNVHECNRCHRFFSVETKKVSDFCQTCTDSSRDSSLLMIVARDTDFETVEKSGAYKGYYFILGGTVPVLDKEPEKRIRLKQLLEEVSNRSSGKGASIKEIILSLNATPDGEHTETIVKEALVKIFAKSSTIKIAVLGRGLSTGAELEYVDSDTIKNALRNRTA